MSSEAFGEVRIEGIPVRAWPSLDAIVNGLFPGESGILPGFGIAINPEKIMRVREDPVFRNIIQQGTHFFADGMGVVLAMRREGVVAGRIAGADLWAHLVQRLAARGGKVYLIGAEATVIMNVRRRLEQQYPNLQILGLCDGYVVHKEEDRVAEEIAAGRPDLVIVAMGTPNQEQLIIRLRRRCPDSFYLGVGGSFDVYVGRVTRAPRWMQRVGLEWLYRVVMQPKRIMRHGRLLRFAWLLVSNRLNIEVVATPVDTC